MIEPETGISVVVPVYNGEKTIRRCVEHLLQQSLKPREIIIVDDGSTDGTRAALEPVMAQIRYEFKPNGGPAAARNHGIKLAAGALVAFTDSDCLPERDWLLKLAAEFTDDEIAGVGSVVRSAERGIVAEYVDLIRLLDPLEDEHGRIPYLITANACFRRAALLEAGLFNERFRRPGGEEPDLCERIRNLGYQFRRVDDAVVLHYHRQTVTSLLKTLANYGEGRYLLAKTHPTYRLNHPLRVWLRSLLAVKSVAHRLINFRRIHGIKRAVAYSWLSYLHQPAYLFGYLRGKWRDA